MIQNHIPEEWISKYVTTLLDIAKKLQPGTFRDSVVLRAEHAMDLVEAWREVKTKGDTPNGL